jgi:hypothetical protein
VAAQGTRRAGAPSDRQAKQTLVNSEARLQGRYVPTVIFVSLVGALSLLAGAWLLTTTATASGSGEILWIAGLLGFGAGITISPALFMAGLSVRPVLVGRAFALVKLLRLAGAFAIVPAFIYFAQAFGMTPPRLMLGLHLVYWVILCGLALTVAACSVIFFPGRARIHAPDLRAYLEDNREALESPPLTLTCEERPPLGQQVSSAVRSTLLLEEERVTRERDEDAEHDGAEGRWRDRQPPEPEASFRPGTR